MLYFGCCRSRVHAQRKFAQGAGGISPLVSPLKEIRSRAKTAADNGSSSSSSSSGPIVLQKGERPKTEDFLTFLCLRGTDFLPPELDFFNQVASTNTGGGSSDEVSSEGEDDKKDPEVDKNGVAKKSAVAKKNAVKERARKTAENQTATAIKKKVDGSATTAEGAATPRQTRIANQEMSSPDKTRSAEKLLQPRQTRSQGDTSRHHTGHSPAGKGSAGKRESDRGVRARQRLQAKEAAAADESSEDEDSYSEQEDGKAVVGGSQVRKGANEEEDEEEEADADEEASSRESSRRPLNRRLEDGKLAARDSPIVRLKQREGRSTSYDSSGSKESLNQVAVRPSRTTKEAATTYLNLLGQKLTSKKRDESPLEASLCPKDLASISPEHRVRSISLKDGVRSINCDQPTVNISRELRADCASQEQTEVAISPKTKGGQQVSDGVVLVTSSSIAAGEEGGDLEPETSETIDSSECKSPKGERRQKDGKRDKKDKKKSKTSLKDLQNILLAEAKRKIADTAESPSAGSPVITTETENATSRPETEERIVISQKTGYISVKPRQSLDSPVHLQQQDDLALLNSSCPSSDQLSSRRNSVNTMAVAASLNGPSGRRLSKTGSERTSTPPRKILPKATTELSSDGGPQRSTASPVAVNVTTSAAATSGRTNHLPVGVMGAAGLSNRFNMTSVATLSKPSAVMGAATMTQSAVAMVSSSCSSGTAATATFSQPLVIQTSVAQQQHHSSMMASTVSSMAKLTGVTTLNIPQSSSCTSNNLQQAAAIIVPAAPDGNNGSHLRMPLQMTAVPIQMAGMQTVQPMSVTSSAAVSVPVLPHVVSHSQQQLSYQSITSIPVLGPGGMHFSIPVQSCIGGGGLSRPQQAAVVTVPSYVRPTAYAAYSSHQQSTPMLAANSLPVVSAAMCHQTGQQQLPQHIYTGAEQQQQHVVVASASHNLPQTITMPSGTTIQYNVNPSSIKQLPTNIQSSMSDSQNKQQQQQQQPPPAVVQAAPVPALSSLISTNTSPLVSPGPPTLSPQITASTHHSRASKSAGVSFSPSSAVSGTKQLARLDGGGNGPPVLTPPVRKSEVSVSDSLVPKSQLVTTQTSVTNPTEHCPTSAVRSSPAQVTYSSSSSYSYPQQLCIDPYQPALYQGSYHQASPHSSSSSYHSPQGVAGHSPAYAQQVEPPPPPPPQAMCSPSYPLSPVQYTYPPPPSHPSPPLPSPTSGNVPPPMQHSPLTPSAQYRNNLQQQHRQMQEQQQMLQQQKLQQQQQEMQHKQQQQQQLQQQRQQQQQYQQQLKQSKQQLQQIPTAMSGNLVI